MKILKELLLLFSSDLSYRAVILNEIRIVEIVSKNPPIVNPIDPKSEQSARS
jgi:hypothetical protein